MAVNIDSLVDVWKTHGRKHPSPWFNKETPKRNPGSRSPLRNWSNSINKFGLIGCSRLAVGTSIRGALQWLNGYAQLRPTEIRCQMYTIFQRYTQYLHGIMQCNYLWKKIIDSQAVRQKSEKAKSTATTQAIEAGNEKFGSLLTCRNDSRTRKLSVHLHGMNYMSRIHSVKFFLLQIRAVYQLCVHTTTFCFDKIMLQLQCTISYSRTLPFLRVRVCKQVWLVWKVGFEKRFRFGTRMGTAGIQTIFALEKVETLRTKYLRIIFGLAIQSFHVTIFQNLSLSDIWSWWTYWDLQCGHRGHP